MDIPCGLKSLTFDNQFVDQLPADLETKNYSRQVEKACFSRVSPSKVSKPQLLAYSNEVAGLLGLSADDCCSEQFSQIFSGNQLLQGMDPYAMCYGGHQFGHWAGQLGDGRAINLGEVVNQKQQRWVLQLKGSGLTPYSRNADGLAVLRSSVREFLCSEAMHHLSVPTTRALSLVLTGDQVTRDMFYDGHSKAEQGAVVCRVSPSFIRFGSFQIFAARGDHHLLRKLVEYTMRTDFSDLFQDKISFTKQDYINWFEQVCRITADMIVHWQRVGFVHGVMNTDNMSILGLTIDYGPYGWLDDYDPDWTPNTTDAGERRYRYGQQPQIALWNLVQLANAIYPLIEEAEPLQQSLTVYNERFSQGWQAMMAEKLGLDKFQIEIDQSLCQTLLALLAEVETDMTIFYRKLALIDATHTSVGFSNDQLLEPFLEAYYRFEAVSEDYKTRMASWLSLYCARVKEDKLSKEQRIKKMHNANPKYVLRNYLSQQAINQAEQGDFSMVNRLLDVMRHPYDEQVENEEFAQKRPEWARNKPGCSRLSCSS